AGRGGKVIIPAFAIGRTQLLLYYIRELEEENRIPVLPVFVDSPMAASATRFYKKHTEDHDIEMRQLGESGHNALATRYFQLVQGRNSSKALNSLSGPAIIISASGMATGGRVLHHLALHLPDPASTVILVGYQAAGAGCRRARRRSKFTASSSPCATTSRRWAVCRRTPIRPRSCAGSANSGGRRR